MSTRSIHSLADWLRKIAAMRVGVRHTLRRPGERLRHGTDPDDATKLGPFHQQRQGHYPHE
jgi:hypothetical protein